MLTKKFQGMMQKISLEEIVLKQFQSLLLKGELILKLKIFIKVLDLGDMID